VNGEHCQTLTYQYRLSLGEDKRSCTHGALPTRGTSSASASATPATPRSCWGGTSARARRSSTPPPPAWPTTIHRAKGTEAQAVALLACEEQLLPSWRSLSSPDPERLAEARRLFYVAATRAKDRLLITHVAERGRRPTGGPSRFLAEAGLEQPASSLAA
jgi:hypothetical protein